MFPYVEQPTLTIGSYTVSAFQVLVGLGVVVGAEVAVRRATRLGLDRVATARVIAWTLIWGFVGSHVLAIVLAEPGRVRANPWLLFDVFGRMSSFGGIAGGLLGGYVAMRRRGLPARDRLAIVDCIAFGFPFAWVFGRLGCALAHDHVGIASEHWLAVQFPTGPRFDLGLLELLFTLFIASGFLVLGHRPRPNGFFVGLFFALYGPGRFALDILRADDPRYFGWTVGQYLSLAAAIIGTAVLWRVRRNPGGPTPASEPARSD
jgi:phosphatidylglycerol:prolipoprotein diacylglycerol transferase